MQPLRVGDATVGLRRRLLVRDRVLEIVDVEEIVDLEARAETGAVAVADRDLEIGKKVNEIKRRRKRKRKKERRKDCQALKRIVSVVSKYV